ncbi:hypothetical protein F4820DRAFT_447632 [Hypoxylon rubiginosum]|uniref:Uncharacterized protein n=1 Tax=Hypoxylon rubiginosum TaxID=110542 RepID=A0ACB9Z433_9PEZI|nr:hypothetical protein F4820DRAFT_447632 [Hypoxylon rubiginosum]
MYLEDPVVPTLAHKRGAEAGKRKPRDDFDRTEDGPGKKTGSSPSSSSATTKDNDTTIPAEQALTLKDKISKVRPVLWISMQEDWNALFQIENVGLRLEGLVCPLAWNAKNMNTKLKTSSQKRSFAGADQSPFHYDAKKELDKVSGLDYWKKVHRVSPARPWTQQQRAWELDLAIVSVGGVG